MKKIVAPKHKCKINTINLTEEWQNLDDELWIRKTKDNNIEIGECVPFTESDKELKDSKLVQKGL